MAIHTIDLSNKQEDALQIILDRLNKNPITGEITGTKTKDDLIKDWVVTPIKEELRRERAIDMERRQTAVEVAPKAVLDQVDVLLAPYMPVIPY